MKTKGASLGEIAKTILKSGAVEVRDLDFGEDPFVYSTGNRGPGYLMIKGLVGQPEILKYLTKNLAKRVVSEAEFDFIEGNATGGMIPGWQLRNDVSEILGREVPFAYLRGSRKEGGQGELITGNANNPLIQEGMRALVVEELVNYAGTTGNAAEEFRAAGYPVSHAACILSYDHEESNARLEEKKVSLISLITLPQLLEVAESENLIPSKAVQSYRDFLSDPLDWQLSRDFVVPGGVLEQYILDLPEERFSSGKELGASPKDSAKRAIEKGYSMRLLGSKEALERGAPAGKVKEGVGYWIKEG